MVSVGVDIVEVGRIRGAIERWGPRFLDRIFTPTEVAYCRAKARPAESFAVRFAAKEAFAKALGSGLRHPATLHSIGVAHDAAGKPLLELDPRLEALLRQHKVHGRHLTLTHERSVACAFVVLERLDG
jgi:holo-[acyl-carrier protein] synthase